MDMTSEAPWEPHAHGYSYHEGHLRSSVNHGVDPRANFDQESRELYPLQLRGQLIDPEPESSNSSVASVDMDEDDMDYIASDPAIGRASGANPKAGFAGGWTDPRKDHASGHAPMGLEEDLCNEDSFGAPSRTIASISQLQDQQIDSFGAPEVDSFAETLLSELGVTENYVLGLGRNKTLPLPLSSISCKLSP